MSTPAFNNFSLNIFASLLNWDKPKLPDKTILLDLDPEIGLKRASSRNELDRFELENLDFHKRLRKSFLDAALAYPDRFLIIDAEEEPKEILQIVIDKLF